jgi:leader peptidase (prepilin peptidase)/N-methyltransferase
VPSVTARAEFVTALGASASSRFGAAWTVVGRRGRALCVLVALAGVVVAALWVPATGAAVATGASLQVLAAAAVVDVVEHRLPNALVGAAAIPVAVAMAISWVGGTTGVVAGALGGAALLGVPLLATHLVSPAGMGFGDVKAGAVLGGALGLIDVQIAVLALFLGLSGSAVWALARHRRSIALGPGLVAGAVVALALARLFSVGLTT